ncbi:MAG: iron-containing alcohol dehydrogenase [Oscillospiraceae bacterium]
MLSPMPKHVRRWPTLPQSLSIAFANAMLGINHSLSHKIGGWFHIPHGTANALMFTTICKFNANRKPTKMGTFFSVQVSSGIRTLCRTG